MLLLQKGDRMPQRMAGAAKKMGAGAGIAGDE